MQLQPSFTALALRAWWPVVVVLAVIGFGVGMYSVGVASYSATALLRVDVSTNPLQSKEIISTAQVLVDSDPVYFRATNGTREAADALRARTSVGIVNDGEVLKVTVVAPTAAAATTQTNKMADAAVVQAQALSVDQFNRVTQLAQDSLKNGSLADVDSEKQRREHVGQNLADAQSAASRSSDLLTRIGGVQAPVAMGLPPRLAGPLGALIGALLGFAASLLLGVRRNRVRRPADLKVVDPRLRVYGPNEIDNGLMRVAARCATLDRPLIAVLALPAAENDLPQVLKRFDRHLHNENLRRIDIDAEDLGRGTTVVDRGRPAQSGGESVGLPARSARGAILDSAKADVIVVSGSAGPRVAREAGARAEAVIVVGKLQASRLKEFFTLYPEISDSSPMVLLARSDSKQASAPDDGGEEEAATEFFGPEGSTELVPDYRPEGSSELVPANHGFSEYRPESVAAIPLADTDRVMVPASVSVSAATGSTSYSVNGSGNGMATGNGNGGSNGMAKASGNGNGNGSANGKGAVGEHTADSSLSDRTPVKAPAAAPEHREESLVDLVRATATATAAAPEWTVTAVVPEQTAVVAATERTGAAVAPERTGTPVVPEQAATTVVSPDPTETVTAPDPTETVAAPEPTVTAAGPEPTEEGRVDLVRAEAPATAPDRPSAEGRFSPSPSPRPRPALRPEAVPEAMVESPGFSATDATFSPRPQTESEDKGSDGAEPADKLVPHQSSWTGPPR
jgi:hypothetical protein